MGVSFRDLPTQVFHDRAACDMALPTCVWPTCSIIAPMICRWPCDDSIVGINYTSVLDREDWT